MSMVNIAEISENDAKEFFMKIKDLSPNVDEYFANQLYREEADTDDNDGLPDDDGEELTYDKKLEIALQMILDEVKQLGIEFTIPNEEVLYDAVYRDLIYYLRYKFDAYNLYELLKRTDKSLKEKIGTIIQSYYNDEPIDETVNHLIELFHSYFPNDLMFSSLYDNIDLYNNNELFIKHIEAILEKIDRYGNTSPVNDTNLEEMSKYLISRMEHLTNVQFATHTILEKIKDVDKNYILKNLKKHDDDRIHGDNVKTFALTYNEEEYDEVIMDDNEYILDKQHHLNNNHHIEYYVSRKIEPDKSELIMILADVYDMKITRDRYMARVSKIIEYGNLYKYKDFIMSIVNILPYQVSTQVKQIKITQLNEDTE